MGFAMSSEEAGEQSNSNILLRLWRGEIVLWKTFWLFGVLGGIIIISVPALIKYTITINANNRSNFDIKIIAYSFFTLSMTYLIIVMVGIWMSSNKYAALYRKSINSKLVKFAAILGALSIVVAIGEAVQNYPDSTQSLFEGKSADEQMQRQAVISGLNADLPKMVDVITRLERIDIKGMNFIYYYTIIKDFDDKQMEQMISMIKPSTAQAVCKRVDAFKMLKGVFVFNYIYSDLSGRGLGSFDINMRDCAFFTKASNADKIAQ